MTQSPSLRPWSRTVTEDVDFVAEARKARSTVVELGVGMGASQSRWPSPESPSSASTSAGMLDVCRRRAEAADVEHLVDLRLGDLRDPPVAERVRLVTSHSGLSSTCRRRRAAPRAGVVLVLLEPGGRFVFDVFAPSAEDVEETHETAGWSASRASGSGRIGIWSAAF